MINLPDIIADELPDDCARNRVRRYVMEMVAAERKRWQRVAENAQAVTTGSEDKIDHFEVPAHLMAALALALDEEPN